MVSLIAKYVFSLLVAIAGWYYMLHSGAAARLGPYEGMPLNRLRIRLRRIGGGAMFLLAVVFFAFFFSIDQNPQHVTRSFFFLLLAIFLLLCTILVLALVDLRLTAKLRRIRQNP